VSASIFVDTYLILIVASVGGHDATLTAKLLKVTPKAVDLMLAQLGRALPRELTGRTRYRAWGIV
jgi:hypothetical protein